MACPSPSAEFSDAAAGDSQLAYQLQPTPNPILQASPEHIFIDTSTSSSNDDNSPGDEPDELDESTDGEVNEDAFSTVSLRDIDILISFYETLLKHSVNTDAFHAISKVTLDLKDLRLSHGEYPKDLQATLGDRLYLAAQLGDYCIVCLSLVPHHENLFLKIRCPTCQAVEFCSGFCSLEQNTHPCRLLNRLRMMSRCKDTYIDTYRDRKNMVIERANILEAHHAEALALDAQREELIRRRGAGQAITNLPESNAELVLTESDQYILTKLQPVCNILGLTRKLYTKEDQVFLKELAESSFTISDLRVKDPFTYAFILKIAFLFSGGMTKVQQEKEKLSGVLKEIRKMSAEFDFNYSFLHQTLTDLKKIMLTASNETADLASVQSVYQACRDTLKMTDKIKLPEQCQAALNDIRKVVYFWNEIRMSNHLIDALNRYYDFVKGINFHEARKKQLQQESTSLTEQIKECQENIVEVKQATLELQTRLDKLKIGIFPSSGPSPAEDTGSVAVSIKDTAAKSSNHPKSNGNVPEMDTVANSNVADSLLKGHSLSALSSKLPNSTIVAEKAPMSAYPHNLGEKLGLDPQSNIDLPSNHISSLNTEISCKNIKDTKNVLALSAVDNGEHGDDGESGHLQRQESKGSKFTLDNLLSFSDVVVSIDDIMSASSSPQPPPQQQKQEQPPQILSESASAEVALPVKRSILEPQPLMAPLSQYDDSPEIPCLKASPRLSQASQLERPQSRPIPEDVPLALKRTLVRSVRIVSGSDDIIASESDPLRLATIARSTISKPHLDVCKPDGSPSFARSSTSDQVMMEFNEMKSRESTTIRSPTFGTEMMESTGHAPPKHQDQLCDQEPRVRESSNLHVTNPKLPAESMFSDKEKSNVVDPTCFVSAVHIIPPKPSTNALNKIVEECTDVVHSCVRSSVTSTTAVTVINQNKTKLSTDHTSAMTDTDTISQTPELDISSQTNSAAHIETHNSHISVEKINIDSLKASSHNNRYRSLSNRYRELHTKMAQRRSIFDDLDSDGAPRRASVAHTIEDRTRQAMHISSMPKNLLDINVTAENSNILTCFNNPPDNSKLSRVIQLNPQKVSQYLNELTISMYTTEVIFLAKVWKTMSKGLLLLGRINSYYSRKAAAAGETYVDRMVGTREQRLVKRAYEAINTNLINIKFEYYSYIKLCHLRFNMSVGTAKNCKWKSSDEVLKFSLTEDQYRRLKQTNALRVNTGKMSNAQREALYTSLRNYIVNGIQIDASEILRAS